jgi:hypothetical protein
VDILRVKCLYGASLLASLQVQRSSKGADKADGCKTQQQQEGPCGLLGRSQAIQMRASKVLGQIHSNALWAHTRPRPYRADALRASGLAHDTSRSSHAQWPVRRAPILDASPPTTRTRTAPGTPAPVESDGKL